jgi:hypothetical protein
VSLFGIDKLVMVSMLAETRLVYDQKKCLKVVGSCCTLIYKQHGMKNIQITDVYKGSCVLMS